MGRRTADMREVAAGLRAAGISDDYRVHYDFLQSVGRRWRELGRRVLALRVVLAGPTARCWSSTTRPAIAKGRTSKGPACSTIRRRDRRGPRFATGECGSRWRWRCGTRLWGTIGPPFWSWLYVRGKDMPKLPPLHGWTFRTKLELAADLVRLAVETLGDTGKRLWAVVAGANAMRAFVRPVTALGVTLVGRLRKDAALRDVPPVGKTRGRGRPRKYDANRLSLAKRAAHPQGWQNVTCTVYGREELKRVKTFLATHRTFGRTIRVVIVKERNGPQFLCSTDTAASPREIVETFADRAAIEPVFHDVKEVWGSGLQQVRNLWANIAVWHVNLWLHTLVELLSWNKPAKEPVHRTDSRLDHRHLEAPGGPRRPCESPAPPTSSGAPTGRQRSSEGLPGDGVVHFARGRWNRISDEGTRNRFACCRKTNALGAIWGQR